ncbi:hypothetical protein OBBRIDRAFT_32366 [Obba rivulosa]|uniref:Uncharacterized protein n=1 Tax=Obba rivulosa TaxID=1052685 RepID=A0A8E2AVW7_9APHY|nr:hypothetical protein OBBRIDRAFT_32366 [Obba rivulosa]
MEQACTCRDCVARTTTTAGPLDRRKLGHVCRLTPSLILTPPLKASTSHVPSGALHLVGAPPPPPCSFYAQRTSFSVPNPGRRPARARAASRVRCISHSTRR